jgi:outer membrane immunogenic protein
MRFKNIVLLTVFLVCCLTASAQAVPSNSFGLEPGQISVMEVGLGYSYFHANAPPSGCGCFSLQGGYGSIAVNAVHGWSIVADLTAAHANNVNNTDQNITIFNYLVGPRYSYRSSIRFTPYVEALVGGAKEISNYSYVQNANGFAVSAGGGLNMRLSRRLGWTVAEADYVYTRLPNASNNFQSDLRVSSGFFFRLGPR